MTDDELIAEYRRRFPRAKIMIRHGRGAWGETQIVEVKDPEYVERAGEAPHCPTCKCLKGRLT